MLQGFLRPTCTLPSQSFPTVLSIYAHFLCQHNNSRVHESTNMKCPMCPRMFKAPSDVAEHIEKGGCNARINRHHVTAAVHAMNIAPTISINKRITGPDSEHITTYSATERAFNGRAYECYLCRRQFGTLNGLNAHLASPAHDSKEFQCPKASCGRKFTVVSALIRHIESEACGIARFGMVEGITHTLTNQFSKQLTYY
jgi:hypothetical protein